MPSSLARAAPAPIPSLTPLSAYTTAKLTFEPRWFELKFKGQVCGKGNGAFRGPEHLIIQWHA